MVAYQDHAQNVHRVQPLASQVVYTHDILGYLCSWKGTIWTSGDRGSP
jgi:hypothetical protein